MSLCLTRAVRRQQQQLLLKRSPFRTATTTSEAASAAKEKSSEAASKASEGLSRVTSSAGSMVSKAGNVLGGIGGRTGRLIGRVQSLIPPTIYYSKVGLELGKIVFESQKMSPPSVPAVQSYLQQATRALRHPSSLFNTAAKTTSEATPQNILSQVRNMDSKQLAGAGIVLAEVIGFFSVGEMLGRLKIVGYRSSAAHAEH